MKIHSEQGQIEELGLKANVEFKIQTINFRGDRTLCRLKNIFTTCKAVTLCGGQWIIYYKVTSSEVKSEPAKRMMFNNWKKYISCLFVFLTYRICPCKIEATLPALLCKFLTNNNACWTIDWIDQLYRYIYFSGWREYYYNSSGEITITWESARFIRIKSIQESFIIWAYIVYISDYTIIHW